MGDVSPKECVTMRMNLRTLALVAVASLPLQAICAKTEYTIVEVKGVSGVSGTTKMVKAVNEKLAEGWKCQGGVTFEQGVFRQAMVRETN